MLVQVLVIRKWLLLWYLSHLNSVIELHRLLGPTTAAEVAEKKRPTSLSLKSVERERERGRIKIKY